MQFQSCLTVNSKLLTVNSKFRVWDFKKIAEQLKRMYHKNNVQDIWFWRDSAGHEVDLVIQNGLTIDLVEIKATQTIMSDLFKGLIYFENNSGNLNISKTLVYAGHESETRTAAKLVSWSEFAK